MALCWAANSIAIRSLPTRLNPFAVGAARAAIGMVLLFLVVLLGGRFTQYRLLTSTQLGYLVASILAGGVIGDVLNISSLRALGVSRAFPLINSYPLMTVLASVALLGERLEWSAIVGALLALGGVYLVVRRPAPRAREGLRTPPASGDGLGALMALATAVCYAAEGTLVSLGAGGVSPLVANSVRAPVVACVSSALAASTGAASQLRGFQWRTVGLLALSALLGWVLAGSLWITSIQLIGPGRAAIVGSTSPLFAVPFSMLFLGERPGRGVLAGTVLTALGIVLVV